MLNKLIGKLYTVNLNNGEWKEFEIILEEISNLHNPTAISMLLPLFDDECYYPEVLFSIVHYIEGFDNRIYCEQLFGGLVSLWKKSPEWAKTLQMRILNSKECLKEYTKLVAQVDRETRRTLTDLLLSICDENDGFEEKAAPLFEGLRSLE